MYKEDLDYKSKPKLNDTTSTFYKVSFHYGTESKYRNNTKITKEVILRFDFYETTRLRL